MFALAAIIDGWTIEVTIDEVFTRHYRLGDPEKLIRLDFISASPNRSCPALHSSGTFCFEWARAHGSDSGLSDVNP